MITLSCNWITRLFFLAPGRINYSLLDLRHVRRSSTPNWNIRNKLEDISFAIPPRSIENARTRARASHYSQIRILIAISRREGKEVLTHPIPSFDGCRRKSPTDTHTRAYVCKIIKNTRLYSHVNNFSALAGGIICIAHASHYYIIRLTMCNVFLADHAIFFPSRGNDCSHSQCYFCLFPFLFLIHRKLIAPLFISLFFSLVSFALLNIFFLN